MDQEFVARVQMLVDRAGGQSALSRKSGLSNGAIQRYLRGGDPTRNALVKLCDACDVSMNWLVYGDELFDFSDQNVQIKRKKLDIYGFGETDGQSGWYDEIKYKIKSSDEINDTEAFAVIISDNMMKNEGIKESDICIFSPNRNANRGDIVYIRKTDSKTSLKIYIREDSLWHYTKGYILPENSSKPASFYEQIKKSETQQICPLVSIRKKGAIIA